VPATDAAAPAFLDADGGLLPGAEPPPAELALRLFRQMLLARRLDERCVNLQRQGRIGTYPPAAGQEGAQVGAALALQPQDWLFPTYRDLHAAVAHGLPLAAFLLYWMGHPRGGIAPTDRPVFPVSVPVGSHVPHAAGAAWAARLRGDAVVALALFGDGATSAGDFHEGLNFAAVLRAPAVFVCQNNGYAISVPLHRQTASASIAVKATAYGMPGLRIDGNDVLAVHAAVRAAADRARAGQGPTLIEAVTYRLGPHTTSDDPSRYRSPAEEAEARRREPLARLRHYLRGAGLLDDAGEERLQAEVAAELDAAEREAFAAPPPAPEELTAHVFAAGDGRR
jgi:pyruvate dehydrogenase E1 component alpha subunit